MGSEKKFNPNDSEIHPQKFGTLRNSLIIANLGKRICLKFKKNPSGTQN